VLRVGIDPEGIPALFQVLVEQRKFQPTVVDGWFASHPLEESRIQAANRLIATLGAEHQGGLSQDSPDYRDFRDRVKNLPEPPRSASPDETTGN
jgi:predicted Zn-dependent protease